MNRHGRGYHFRYWTSITDTLENNSLKGGDIGQKMSKSHKNIHVSLGFPLKIKIVLKIQELLDFQWQP